MRKLERQELTKLMMTKWLNKKRLIIYCNTNKTQKTQEIIEGFSLAIRFPRFYQPFLCKKSHDPMYPPSSVPYFN